MSFWLTAGPWDKAYEWTTLSASDRSSIKSKYHAAGIKLMVAAFGSTDVPTSAGADPVATANNLASFVKTYGLDGVDVDYEVGSLSTYVRVLDRGELTLLHISRTSTPWTPALLRNG